MNKKLANIFKGDKVIWMVFFFLCIISVVEVFSASSELTYRNGSFLAPMVKHVGLLILGFFLMLVTLNVPCQYFKVATPFLILISIATLIIVFFIGRSTNGAQRWIPILGFQFQPSEIAKGTLVLATAQILSAMQTKDGCDRRAMQYILWVCLAIIPLIMMENLSTAALLCLVIFMMMFIGRVPGAQLGKLAGLVVILCVSIVTCVMVLGQDNSKELAANHLTEQTAMKAEKEESSGIFHRFDTWKSRIMKFSDGTEIPPEKVDLDKDAQTAYANVAIASSNIIGKGPGNSVARDFLSQAFSDFIYAIIIEEMGLVGAFFVAMLYIILLFRTGRIANRCERSFSAFLAMGLALLLVTQALFNMCVAVGLAPVTGQPLPLISKGGTSTIINCVYIGMILSISKSAKKNALSVEETSKATAVAA
jgi:cell division protein FtsW